MIETPKEFQLTLSKPVQANQKNGVLSKPADPLAQDIVEQFVKINGQKSQKVYKKLSLLGKGGFAECFLTQQKDTNRQAATKAIPKKLLDSHRTKIRLANEIKLHKSLRHENVVQFYNTFEDDQNVYINLEVCEHGSINDLLRARYSFKTPEVQSFLYGICQGLKYLHSRNIIHRDLKLGNLFLNSDLQVKIGDFGLACKLQFPREFKRTICGTPNYIAPQILQGKGYHFQIDVWSLGVIIYTLFFTIPPFETEEPHTTYQKIRKCDYQFPKQHEAPPEAVDLIRKILVQNPANRLTIDQILESPFMKLGGSIPLGLPACCLKRPPSKRQILNWSRLMTAKQPELKEINSTMLGFFGIGKRSEKTICAGEKNEVVEVVQKQKQQISIPIFCKTVEQSEQETVIYYLSNGKFGVYDLACSEIYFSQIRQKPQKQIEWVKKSSLNESGNMKESWITWAECKHKVTMNIKYKELLQENRQIENGERSTNVQKINIYKDVIMLRLTNRAIQVVYKQKDGFLLSPNRKCLMYFYSFKDMEIGTEVDLSSALGVTDKENKLNSSGQFSINSIFKQKRPGKHLLTMKKIAYLKGILTETVNKNRKN